MKRETFFTFYSRHKSRKLEHLFLAKKAEGGKYKVVSIANSFRHLASLDVKTSGIDVQLAVCTTIQLYTPKKRVTGQSLFLSLFASFEKTFPLIQAHWARALS